MILKPFRLFQFSAHHILKVYNSSSAGSSFDPRLLEKFKPLLDDYWSPSGKVHKLHALNRLLVPQIYNTFYVGAPLNLEELIPRAEFGQFKVLDIGCGGGITSESLAELHFDVVGIDPNPDLIRIAQSHQEKNRFLFDKSLSYHNTTVEDFAKLHPQEFDIVIISEVLEYLPFWKKKDFLKLCTTFCKDNGKIFITTINEDFLPYFYFLLTKLTGVFNAPKMNYFNGINETGISAMLQASGCTIRITRGFTINFLQRRFEFSMISSWIFVYAIKKCKSTQ